MKVRSCCGSLALTQSKYTEREREKERERQTERETDRQTDRNRERERWVEARGTEQLNRQNETLKDRVFLVVCLFVFICFFLPYRILSKLLSFSSKNRHVFPLLCVFVSRNDNLTNDTGLSTVI